MPTFANGLGSHPRLLSLSRLYRAVGHTKVDNDGLLGVGEQRHRLGAVVAREDARLEHALHALEALGQLVDGPQALGGVRLVLFAVEEQGREGGVDDVVAVVRHDGAGLAGEAGPYEGLDAAHGDELPAHALGEQGLHLDGHADPVGQQAVDLFAVV